MNDQTMNTDLAEGAAHAERTEVRGPSHEGGVLELHTLTSFAEMEAIADQWRALEGEIGADTQFFQSYNWCWHCARKMSGPDGTDLSVRIVAGFAGGRLVLIWPLSVKSAAFASEAHWLGEPLTQYGDVLLAPSPAARVWLLEAIEHIKEWDDIDALYLRRVRADAAVHDVLRDSGYQLATSAEAMSLDLTKLASRDDFEARLSRKSRRNLRRAANRLDAFANLRFETYGPGPDAEYALQAAIDFKSIWLKQHGEVSSAFSDESSLAALRSIVRGTHNPVDCLVSYLCSDEGPLAVEVGFQWHGRYYAHIGAFNPWLHKYSPGTVQMMKTVEHCIAAGGTTYDLLAPADDYKRRWTDTETVVHDFAIPLNMRGSAFTSFYLNAIRPGIKRLYGVTPPPLRRRFAALIGTGS